MKKHVFLIGLFFITTSIGAQELKIFINGNASEEISCQSLGKDDLMRIVFTNKANVHRLRIASLLVTLIPKKKIAENNSPIDVPMSFYIDNPSKHYSTAPSFTFLMLEKLNLLKYNYDSVIVKVKKLESNTPEGNQWIQQHVVYNEVRLKGCPIK